MSRSANQVEEFLNDVLGVSLPPEPEVKARPSLSMICKSAMGVTVKDIPFGLGPITSWEQYDASVRAAEAQDLTDVYGRMVNDLVFASEPGDIASGVSDLTGGLQERLQAIDSSKQKSLNSLQIAFFGGLADAKKAKSKSGGMTYKAGAA